MTAMVGRKCTVRSYETGRSVLFPDAIIVSEAIFNSKTSKVIYMVELGIKLRMVDSDDITFPPSSGV